MVSVSVNAYLIDATEREMSILDKAIEFVNSEDDPIESLIACLMFSNYIETCANYEIDESYSDLIGKYSDNKVDLPYKGVVDAVYMIGWL
jgi:hypothetical protein